MVNGVAAETLGLRDRALHYGDGLFETLALEGGKLLCWERHLQRLALGCGKLGIAAPPAELLLGEAQRLCQGVDRAVLKMIISRGAGGRGYTPPAESNPVRVLGLYPMPHHSAERTSAGIALDICRIRLPHQPALAGLKHLNRLEQVLARIEIAGSGADDGLLLDPAGHVVEATASNIFAVAGKRLLTPDLSQAGVAGIIRSVILQRAPAWGFSAEVRSLKVEEFIGADETFLSNSIAGIVPVRKIGSSELRVGPESARVRLLLGREHCIPT